MLENNSPIEANISLGSQEFQTHFDLSFHIIKSLIILTIIVFSIINNVLVIISVMLFRRLRHINNYFLVSLAFADLSVAIFAMTFKATVEITGRWNFTLFMCDFWNSMDVHASTVSTLHLCCISVDRYYAIARPLQYHMVITVRVACGMMALAWLAPTAISFLPIFMGWYTTDEFLAARPEHPDECLFVVNKTYAFLSSSLTFWLPVLVMITLYYRIYKEAKRHRAAIRRHSVPMVCHPSLAIPTACSIGVVTPSSYSLNIMIGSGKLGGLAPQPNYVTSGRRSSSSCPRLQLHREGTRRRSLTGVSSGASSSISPSPSPSSQGCNTRLTLPHSSNNSVWSGHPGQITLTPGTRVTSSMAGPCAAERRAVRSANWRKEHKAFVTLGLVMGAFLVCWLPFFLWYLVSTVCTSCPPTPDTLVAILFWIGYFNSTLNPLIYVMTNQEFKEAFTSILRRICCCRPQKTRISSYTFSQTRETSQARATLSQGHSEL